MLTLSVLFLLLSGESSSTAFSSPVYGRFYFVYGNWNQTEARNVCRENYTDLVTVYSEQENTELEQMLGDRGAWIGLHRDGLKWSNKDPVKFNKLTGDCGEYDTCCAAMKADRSWERMHCTVKKAFMCYKQEASSQTPTYHVINDVSTWSEAQSYCKEKYTDLVSIGGDQQNEDVYNAGKNTNSFWIGLKEHKWRWADGGKYSYTNWHNGKPDESGYCVKLMKQGKWFSVPCDNHHSALCYSTFNHVSDEVLNWEKALDYCHQENRAGLLIIDSQAAQNDVEAELRKRNISNPVWVGLMQSQLFGFWIWPNRKTVFPYSNWDESKQPEHLVSEHCGAVVPQNGFRWSDKNCQAQYRALCHIKCPSPI